MVGVGSRNQGWRQEYCMGAMKDLSLLPIVGEGRIAKLQKIKGFLARKLVGQGNKYAC